MSTSTRAYLEHILSEVREGAHSCWQGSNQPNTPKPRTHLTEEESQEAWARLRRHAGAVSLGHPTHMDDASIEADLAHASEDTHEQGK